MDPVIPGADQPTPLPFGQVVYLCHPKLLVGHGWGKSRNHNGSSLTPFGRELVEARDHLKDLKAFQELELKKALDLIEAEFKRVAERCVLRTWLANNGERKFCLTNRQGGHTICVRDDFALDPMVAAMALLDRCEAHARMLASACKVLGEAFH